MMTKCINVSEKMERKVKGEVEDTILLSSNSSTSVQERGGARGDKALHDTFIRYDLT